MVYNGDYAAGEIVPEWPDILAVFMDQELVKRGCELSVKNQKRVDPAKMFMGKPVEDNHHESDHDELGMEDPLEV